MEEERPNTETKKKKSKIICNVAFTKYEVVKHVASKVFGYKLSYDEEDEEWDILWTDQAVPPERLAHMKLYQKINHFPGMYSISRKNYLAYNLTKLKKRFPEEYNFFPRTWVVPCDMGDLRNFMQTKKNPYVIVKPEASCQGRGIYLTNRLDDIDPSEKHVVQEYLEKPFLIDDLKFDLRIYVLVAGCDPLRLYIHEQGLTRFATEEYEKPNEDNIEDMCMHLTNYAVNKNNPNFIHNENSDDDDIGHKRSLQSTYDYLEENGYDVVTLKAKIDDMLVKTLCSIQPNLAHHYHSCQPEDITNGMCFEVLGFDVMLDSKLNPYVLEVNHTPSFTTDSPLDKKIKKAVIGQALKIMNISARNRKEYFKKTKEEIQKRALTGKMERDSKEVRAEKMLQHQLKRDKWESKHLGGYRKIYPVEGFEKYDVMTKAADDIWQEWTGTKMNRVRKTEENKVPPMKTLPPQPPKSQKTDIKRVAQKGPDIISPHRCPSANLPGVDSPGVNQSENEKHHSLKVFDRLSKPVVRKFRGTGAAYLPPVIYSDETRPSLATEKKTLNPSALSETSNISTRGVNVNLVNSILSIQNGFKTKKTDAKSRLLVPKSYHYIKTTSARDLVPNDELYKTIKPKLMELDTFSEDKQKESFKKWNL